MQSANGKTVKSGCGGGAVHREGKGEENGADGQSWRFPLYYTGRVPPHWMCTAVDDLSLNLVIETNMRSSNNRMLFIDAVTSVYVRAIEQMC